MYTFTNLNDWHIPTAQFSFLFFLRPRSDGVVNMAGTKEGVELPDIGVLRQLCRAELASRLDSVSIII